MSLSDEIFDQCWLFVRGDMTVSEFEKWIYEASELESFFPEDFYMNLISTNYSLESEVYVLKQSLKNEIAELATRDCECHTLPNLADVDMGDHAEIFATLDEKAKFGEPLWWLWLAQCSACEQFWMIGSEERMNDVFVMKRLSSSASLGVLQDGRWPDDFKEYRTLLGIGRERGHSVRFVDPIAASLIHTVIDLAKAEPGIGLQEIATLLQVDIDQAESIAYTAENRARISISR